MKKGRKEERKKERKKDSKNEWKNKGYLWNFFLYFNFSDSSVEETYGTVLIIIFTSGSFHTNAGKYRTFKYIWM